MLFLEILPDCLQYLASKGPLARTGCGTSAQGCYTELLKVMRPVISSASSIALSRHVFSLSPFSLWYSVVGLKRNVELPYLNKEGTQIALNVKDIPGMQSLLCSTYCGHLFPTTTQKGSFVFSLLSNALCFL